MAKARTWNLRFNLDQFNADAVFLRSETDDSDYLRGLQAAGNGADPIPSPSPAWARGYAFGATMRAEAEGFRAKMQQRGKLGGNPNLMVNHQVNPEVIHTVNQMDNWEDFLGVNHMDNPIHNPQSNQNPPLPRED